MEDPLNPAYKPHFSAAKRLNKIYNRKLTEALPLDSKNIECSRDSYYTMMLINVSMHFFCTHKGAPVSDLSLQCWDM